ncbi:MAG: enoyl-CoA hydratase-related protein, partial [Pseudomonadota bacterium]
MPTTLTSSENVAIIHWDDGKANAVNFELIDAMNQHLDKVERDADALVIVGRPGVFCGGFELKILREASDETVEDLIEQGGELAERLFTFPKPVVIASTGHAIAQGAAFLLSADFRIG